jgi:hypothetical protein
MPAAFAVLILLAAFPTQASAEPGWDGSLNFVLARRPANGDLQPTDTMSQYGLAWSFGRSDWPIKLAFDLVYAKGDGVEKGEIPGIPASPGPPPVLEVPPIPWEKMAETSVMEMALGVRKEWGEGITHPFLGGGLEGTYLAYQSVYAEVGSPSVTQVDDNDTAVGIWLDAGSTWRIGKRFNLGFEVRYSFAEVRLEVDPATGHTERKDASALQYGLVAGWGF